MAIVKGGLTLEGLMGQRLHIPLGEGFLKQVRVVLIQKSKPGVEDTSERSDLTPLFASILKTAQVPTLSQPHRALSCDVISIWLIRSTVNPLLNTPLVDSIWAPLVTIVLTHFDDAQSSLSKALKDLLGNILTFHPESSNGASTTSTPLFAQALALQLLTAIHNTTGKKVGYYILTIILKKRLLPASYILTTFTSLSPFKRSLVTALLFNLQDRTLSPSVGKALVTMLYVLREELQNDNAWMQLWNEPLKEALKNEALRGNVQIYVLPGLFKVSPQSFRSFVCGLGLARYSGVEKEENDVIMQAEGGTDGEVLMSLLCCLKVGKDLGYVTEGEKDEMGGGEAKQPTPSTQLPIAIPSTSITPFIAHPHPHIRLAALTLLTHAPAATLPLPASSFAALKLCLPPLHTETDAEVRNLVIQSMRSLIERLGSSSYVIEKELLNSEKKVQRAPQEVETIREQEKRKILRLEKKINEVKSFIIWYLKFLQTQLQPGANYQRVTTALRILTVLIRSGLDTTLTAHVPTDPKKKGLFNWPTRFAGTINIFAPAMRRVLLDALFNPFDDVRVMASDVLLFSPDCGVDGVKELLERGLESMNVSGRARDADGVAQVLSLWLSAVGRGVNIPAEVWGICVPPGKLGVINWTLEVLESYLTVAREDFQRAVRERPVHGLLSGLRLMLERKDVYSVEGVEKGELRVLVGRVFRACEEIWDITKGVLCDESPEGYMPVEEEEDEDLNTQTVMSYSWRGVKESSSLLGTILSHAPYSTATGSILSQKDFETTGDLLLAQLSNIRHRGAFSAVSPSFISLCTVCSRSAAPVLQLPKQWLEDNLGLILSKSKAITRRSAGLPYLITGILISETSTSRPLLHSTFMRLTSITTLPTPTTKNGEKMDLPQVHALNCMKFLFTDSRLSDAVGQYIDTGLELATNCFGSEIWAIRNCGIMMFTTLLNRLFGARRSRNNYVYMQPAFDTHGFFSRYPNVRNVLLRNLREKVGALEENGVCGIEMVYPALSLIARLDYADGYEEMEEFEGLIERCMGSRIWKVREMAAKAYATLVGCVEWVQVVERLLAGTAGAGQNKVHGSLCAVRALLERKTRKGDDLSSVWRVLGSVFDALVKENRCAVTKASYLQILTDYAISAGLLESSDEPSTLRDSVSNYCKTSAEVFSEITHTSLVGRSLFKEQLASFMVSKALKYPADNGAQEIITLLDRHDEEVALAVANLLLGSDSRLELKPKEAASLDSTLWSIIIDHGWDQLRVTALKLICFYGTSKTDIETRWRAVMDLVQTPPTEPCKDAALAALGVVTEKIWFHFQTIEGGEIWAVWCLEQLVANVKIAAHEDQPYPTRESALGALKALTPMLKFKRIWDWRSEKEKMRGIYFVLYDMLNDDDEDIRNGAAKIVCNILPGEAAVSYISLRAGDALASEINSVLYNNKTFFGDVAARLKYGAEDVSAALENVLKADTILFAREKQNLFIDGVLEAEKWGCVLSSLTVDGFNDEVNDFVFWVITGLVAFTMKVKELGREGALGWMSDEDVFVLGTKVIEGLRAVGYWSRKGDIRDAALWWRAVSVGRELMEELGRVGGHELLGEKLGIIVGED